MRRLTVIAVLAFGLTACGGSGAPQHGLQIQFGRVGPTHSIVPYKITIAPDGTVTKAGEPQVPLPKSITSEQHEKLDGLLRGAMGKLKSVQCAHTIPDAPTNFIIALGKTVYVHGECEQRFRDVFRALTNELGLNP